MRRRYRLVVLAYVVMPEHIHLLLSEPRRATLSTVIQALKLGFVRSLYGSPSLSRGAPGLAKAARPGTPGSQTTFLTETVKDVPGQTVKDLLGLDIQRTDVSLGTGREGKLPTRRTNKTTFCKPDFYDKSMPMRPRTRRKPA